MVARADISKVLQGTNFPVSKQELIDQAKSQNASEEVISALEEMDKARFDTLASVFHELGEEAGEAAA